MEELVRELEKAKDLIVRLTFSGATDEEIGTAVEYSETILRAIKYCNRLNEFKERNHIYDLAKKYM